MKQLVTYLTFDGNCREAMTFYAEALGGKLSVMDVNPNMPGCGPGGPDAGRVLHAHVALGSAALMASDTMSTMPFQFIQGTNFAISIDCDSLEEQDRFFAALGEGGSVTMALQDTFWGARFGMLLDKFGITWMFNLDLGQHPAA